LEEARLVTVRLDRFMGNFRMMLGKMVKVICEHGRRHHLIVEIMTGVSSSFS
jgi:hypothetical protein